MDPASLVRLSNHPAAHVAANLYQYRRQVGYAVNAAGVVSRYVMPTLRSSLVSTRSGRRRSLPATPGLRGTTRRVRRRSSVYRPARSFARRQSYRQRRRRRQNFYKVGVPYSRPANRRQIFNSTVNLDSRTLEKHSLCNIPFGTDNEMDRRKSSNIWVKGIKICAQVRNNKRTVVTFNYAVISPFDDDSNLNTDFFRSAVTARAIDFSTSLSSNILHCRAINTDRFHVFTHKRLILESEGGGTNDINQFGPRNFKFINRYIPINRMFRYEKNTDDEPLNNVFLVYWCDAIVTPGGSGVETGYIKMELNQVIYFKNIM